MGLGFGLAKTGLGYKYSNLYTTTSKGQPCRTGHSRWPIQYCYGLGKSGLGYKYSNCYTTTIKSWGVTLVTAVGPFTSTVNLYTAISRKVGLSHMGHSFGPNQVYPKPPRSNQEKSETQYTQRVFISNNLFIGWPCPPF
jgi:hypothetical protein